MILTGQIHVTLLRYVKRFGVPLRHDQISLPTFCQTVATGLRNAIEAGATALQSDRLVYKQLPLSSRRNLRPMKRIYWSLLMCHEHMARSLIELMQSGHTSSR